MKLTVRRMNVVALFILALALSVGIAGAETPTATVTIKIDGMHCGNCAASVEKKLKATEGVEEAKVSFPKKEAWIKYDDQKTSVAKLREVIKAPASKRHKASLILNNRENPNYTVCYRVDSYERWLRRLGSILAYTTELRFVKRLLRDSW